MGTRCHALLLLAKRRADVRLWSRDPEHAIESAARTLRVNARHLPGIKVPETVRITAAVAEAALDADLIAAVPTSHLRSNTLTRIGPRSFRQRYRSWSVVKGIEYGTFARPSQLIEEGGTGSQPYFGAQRGRAMPRSLARGLPASVVVSGRSTSRSMNRFAMRILLHARFSAFTRAATRLGVGAGHGVASSRTSWESPRASATVWALGDNAEAPPYSRGPGRNRPLGRQPGRWHETFYGLAGVGDVVTTWYYSPYGRNRSVGERIWSRRRLRSGARRDDQRCRRCAVSTRSAVHGRFAIRALASRCRSRPSFIRSCSGREKPPRSAVATI